MIYKGIPIQSITLLKTPLIYLELVALLLLDLIKWLKNFVIKQYLFILILSIAWLAITKVSALHFIDEIVYFILYWVVLGIASSIGLGTGLHTFVLYLGPYIAKVAMASTHCGYLPDRLPSRWSFDHFEDCQQHSSAPIGIFGIILAVQIQSFLWGLGTAIGELPPYFVAYKAAETRAELKRMSESAEGHPHVVDEEEKKLIEKQQKVHHLSNEEIQQVLELKRKANKTFMEKAKIFIYDNMEQYGFGVILACASIPNPLFDLAGITCGHFRIPFKKFFSATFIGKAIIKVHIQMVFVVSVFRKETVTWMLGIIQSFSSQLAATAERSLEQQKKVLYQPSRFTENKPLFAKLWDVFIIFMVGYFLKSIIDGQVQEKAIELSSSNKLKSK